MAALAYTDASVVVVGAPRKYMVINCVFRIPSLSYSHLLTTTSSLQSPKYETNQLVIILIYCYWGGNMLEQGNINIR